MACHILCPGTLWTTLRLAPVGRGCSIVARGTGGDAVRTKIPERVCMASRLDDVARKWAGGILAGCITTSLGLDGLSIGNDVVLRGDIHGSRRY